MITGKSRLPAAMATGAIALSALLAPSAASATAFNFNDFSSVAGLTLNGSAAQVGNVLRLTPEALFQGGSAFNTTQTVLGANVSFSTFFSFRISSPQGNLFGDGDGPGADGLVFVVQTVANNVGGAGGGIGYQGIGNSVGIEFDTYDNGGGLCDPDGNHVAIDLNGSLNNGNCVTAPVATRLNNGQPWFAWVDYNGATNDLEVRLSQSNVRPGAALLSQNVDLAAVLGTPNAFVGFTSGTGSGVGNHDILSWEFRDTFAPISNAPAPGILALAGIGLLGMGMASRRKA